MNITKVIIIHHIDPFGNKVGGIASYIKGFIKYAPDDFEIKLIGVSSDPKERKSGRWHNLTLENKDISFHPLFSVKNQNVITRIPLSLKFAATLMYHRFNVRNSILCFHRPELALPYLLNKNNKILYIHNDILKAIKSPITEARWKYFPELYFKLEKLIIPKVKKLYVVNRDALDYYLSTFPHIKDRFEFLPTWADAEIFHPLLEDERNNRRRLFINKKGFNIDDRLIIFIGRFEEQKSPLFLLDSFNYALRKNSHLRLILIGEGGLRKKMEQKIIDLNIQNSVIFLGSISQQQVAEILPLGDLLLLTSDFEGGPRAAMEALASGIPVVTTEAGEVKLVVKDGFSGRVVKERTPEDIGSAILEVLNSKNYSTKNCLNSVADFTPKKILKRVYDTIREISRN